jgi:type VI secretion system protein ImpG
MDPRLLRLYSDELTHLREVGGEFAREFPKIASRLGMEGMEVTDPYVERLLEGFAFLAARVQLKLESEQPRLIAHLLESTYPNFLAPMPSMMIARLGIDAADPNLAKGFAVPRGSALMSELPRGQDTRCEFRTAQAVTLWPIELVNVQYFTHAPDLPLARLPQVQGTKGGLRIRLRAGGGILFNQMDMDRLTFFISAPDEVAFRLHELVLGAHAGTLVNTVGAAGSAGSPSLTAQWRGPPSVQPIGFASDEALLPESLRAFSGYRLLQEVAAMPQRLLFFEIGDLASRLSQVADDEVELIVMFQRGDAALEALVDASSLALFCTPAINLFRKRVDRIQLGPGSWEYQVVPDRTRPMDYEVHSLDSVVGFGTGRVAQQEFLPLYATYHEASPHAQGETHGFYTVRREPRLMSQRQQQHGPRSSYIGEEVYVSLVDPRHAPYREDVRQLSVSAWVSNRDLPTLLPHAVSSGGPQSAGSANQERPAQWRLDAPGPVLRVDAVRGPTRPNTRRPVGDLGWSLVSHLTLNHLSLVGESPQRAAATLRTMLGLYAAPEDVTWARHADGVRALEARTVVRRLPFKGPLSFGTGTEIVLELDELAYQGTSAFLFASVLERFFARHAAINSFTQLTLRTPQRGEVMRWPPRIGLRETV